MFILDALFVSWLVRRFLRKNNLRVAVVPGPDTGPATPSGGTHGVEPVRHAQAGEPATTLPQRVPEPRSGPNWDSLAGSPEPEYEARQEAHSDAASEVDLGIQARAFWAAKGWEGALRGECQHPFDPACPRQRELVSA